eukprot:2073675-Amphidinium_carterae.1
MVTIIVAIVVRVRMVAPQRQDHGKLVWVVAACTLQMVWDLIFCKGTIQHRAFHTTQHDSSYDISTLGLQHPRAVISQAFVDALFKAFATKAVIIGQIKKAVFF